MRILLLACITLLSSGSGATSQSHDNHERTGGSLLEECLTPMALPSPHCGRVPTAVFGRNGILYVVFSQHGHIYLTTSSDRGKAYRAPTAVNRVPEMIYDDGENRPKITLGKNDEVFVSWTHKTTGRFSGNVRFARSTDGGKTFDSPMTINSDRTTISHRFESMTLDQQGRIFLVWVDKRDQADAKKDNRDYAGASLYYAISDDSGESFGPNHKLTDHSCECCRVALDSDSSGRVVALWRHLYPVNLRDHAISYVNPEFPSIEGMPTRASDDGWIIDGCPHHGPDLSIDSKDRAHMAWFTQGKRNRGLMYGRFDFANNRTWMQKSIDDSPAASRPQVQVFNNEVYLMWKRFNGVSMDLLLSRSGDDGRSWSAPEYIATTDNGSDHPDWVSAGQQLFASWHTQSEGLRLIPVIND